MRTESKMQTESEMQTADLLSESSCHFHHRGLTGELFRRTRVIFRLNVAQTFARIDLNNSQVSVYGWHLILETTRSTLNEFVVCGLHFTLGLQSTVCVLH